MTRTPGLALAALTAVGSVVVAWLLRLGPAAGVLEATPDELSPLLLATAALCVVGLARAGRPSLAWLAAIAALSLATVEIAGVTRALRPSVDPDAWRWLATAVCLGAVGSSAAAVAFAAEPHRRVAPWAPVVGGTVVTAILAASVWALATTEVIPPAGADATSLGTLSVVTRSFVASVAVFVTLGLLGDSRPAGRRARQRIAVVRSAPGTTAERIRWVAAWLGAFVDEISPGRTRAHRAALSERSRIARDLHAEVVPAVRRALAEAERDGSAERLAVSLRDVLREVDALVGSEHAIQLEFGGLVAALEWLAERVEERSAVRVSLDVADGDPDRASLPPMEVAAAAFRVAGLALENVIRHAPGSQASVQVEVARDRVHLVVADDGPGLPSDIERSATAAGHRGLADMVAEASGCGAIVTVGPARDTGDRPGTVVTFHWPATAVE
jgi:signal transduction histidine kinase